MKNDKKLLISRCILLAVCVVIACYTAFVYHNANGDPQFSDVYKAILDSIG